MNLIETSQQIDTTSDHSVSSNNSFKSLLNAQSFNMFLTCSCAKHGDSASVSFARVVWSYKGDVNSTSGKNKKNAHHQQYQ